METYRDGECIPPETPRVKTVNEDAGREAEQHNPSAEFAGCNADSIQAKDIRRLDEDSLLHSFAKRLKSMQKDMPPEFKKIVDDHFSDLLA